MNQRVYMQTKSLLTWDQIFLIRVKNQENFKASLNGVYIGNIDFNEHKCQVLCREVEVVEYS